MTFRAAVVQIGSAPLDKVATGANVVCYIRDDASAISLRRIGKQATRRNQNS